MAVGGCRRAVFTITTAYLLLAAGVVAVGSCACLLLAAGVVAVGSCTWLLAAGGVAVCCCAYRLVAMWFTCNTAVCRDVRLAICRFPRQIV